MSQPWMVIDDKSMRSSSSTWEAAKPKERRRDGLRYRAYKLLALRNFKAIVKFLGVDYYWLASMFSTLPFSV